MGQVPDTSTFSLLDVVNVVGGSSLLEAIILSNDSYFDPAYKGSKNSLYCFRNYIQPSISLSFTYVLFNYDKTITDGSDNIEVLYAGGTYTYSWATGAHFSYTKAGNVFTITCNENNTSGDTWSDTLRFYLSAEGLSATFDVYQTSS